MIKTRHLLVEDSVKTKHVQVDIIPENEEDCTFIDDPLNKSKIDNHIMSYLQKQFPDYSVNKTIEANDFPRRTVIEIVKPNSI
ncbi:MAG: hypothetical protein WDZ35_13410 [Crocinitomicaceae bacterium]